MDWEHVGSGPDTLAQAPYLAARYRTPTDYVRRDGWAPTREGISAALLPRTRCRGRRRATALIGFSRCGHVCLRIRWGGRRRGGRRRGDRLKGGRCRGGRRRGGCSQGAGPRSAVLRRPRVRLQRCPFSMCCRLSRPSRSRRPYPYKYNAGHTPAAGSQTTRRRDSL